MFFNLLFFPVLGLSPTLEVLDATRRICVPALSRTFPYLYEGRRRCALLRRPGFLADSRGNCHLVPLALLAMTAGGRIGVVKNCVLRVETRCNDTVSVIC
ncbi:MAG TPA: hypothetical protein PLN86_09770 [Candidatus Hydrogenedentes bacterium]|nr:hypothetical protein [Candidatus Hydrogenedentota bacterium]